MIKVLIINSNYYKNISKNLISNAKKVLVKEKYKIDILEAPGVFEIPFLIKKNIKKYDAFVALGCVIKGDTPHFNLICESTFNAILEISINFNKPITNGIITALNLKQAINRSKNYKSKKPNKGSEAAHALIKVIKSGPKSV